MFILHFGRLVNCLVMQYAKDTSRWLYVTKFYLSNLEFTNEKGGVYVSLIVLSLDFSFHDLFLLCSFWLDVTSFSA